MAYSIESFFRVYDDDNGCFYEIRPDSDALGCVEVSYSDGGKGDALKRCLTVPPQMARLLAQAIEGCADKLEKL